MMRVELPYEFSAAELVAAIGAVVPSDQLAVTGVSIQLDLGPFPSGAEGAEDWMMSSRLTAVEFSPATNWRGPVLTLEVDHS